MLVLHPGRAGIRSVVFFCGGGGGGLGGGGRNRRTRRKTVGERREVVTNPSHISGGGRSHHSAIHHPINSSLLIHHFSLKRDKAYSCKTVYCCKACWVLSSVRGMCHSFNHIMKRGTIGKHFRQVRGNGRLAGWLAGWMDEWMGMWLGGWKYLLFFRIKALYADHYSTDGDSIDYNYNGNH